MPPTLVSYLRSARFTFARGFRHGTGRSCLRHRHGAYEIVYHERGRGFTCDEDGRRVAFEAGDVVLYGPGVAHDQTVEGRGEDVCVQVAARPAPPGPIAGTMRVPQVDEEVRGEILALAGTSADLPPMRALACDHRCAALLLRLLEAAQPSPDGQSRSAAEGHAEAAHDFVRENATRIESIAEVAEAVGVGYDHLRHVFRRRYGKSIKRWHLELRVERAKDLVAHTTVPLKQVASQCGFATARYFSSCFRKLVGATPGRYRRLARQVRR
jgi:AraC-like DNA-binding protein